MTKLLILVETFFKNEDKVIVSTDKDFFQLVDNNTTILSPRKNS